MGVMSLEAARALIPLFLFACILFFGVGKSLNSQKGWGWIISGVGLIFFGTLMDTLEEIRPSILPESLPHGSISFLENAVGYLLGFVSLSIGLWKWAPNAAESLRARSELDLIYENALVGMALTRDRRIIRANRVMEEMFGWDRSQLIGQSTGMFFATSEDHEQIGMDAYSLIEKGGFYQAEKQLKKKDGSLIWVRMSGRLVDGAGVERGAIWIIQDIEERKRAENLLRNSEERFRLLSESAFEGIIIHQGGHIAAVNQAAADLMRASEAELIGSPVFDFISPECHDLVRKNVQSGYDKPYEITGLRKTGDRIPLEVRGRPVVFQGRQARIVAIMDISERKRLEEETRKSSEFFRTLVEESPDLIATLTLGGEFFRVNRACAALAENHDPNGLIGKRIAYLAVEGAENIRAALAKAARAESSTAQFKTVSYINGGDLWWDMRLIPLRDRSNAVTSAMMVARDVTEERMAVEALRKSEEKYRNVINTTSEGFWAVGENLETVEVNDSLLKTLGYSRDEMMKLSVLDLVDEANRETVLERLTQIASTTHRRYDVALRAADGSRIPMVFNGTTIRDKDGHVTGAFSFVTDISEMKRVLDKLEKAKEAAENASRLKDKFVSLVSHDLKSPMVSILALLDVLRTGKSGPLDPRQEEMISKACGACEGLIAMTDRLLDMGRLRSGKLALDRKFTDLAHLVSLAFDGSRIAAEAKGITFVSRAPAGMKVFVDRELIMSALGNLISNAVKFSHRGGVVEVGVECSDGVVLSVRDHGVGMTREDALEIFGPGEKPSRAGTAGEKGAGLGLTLSSEIARAHGGRIWAESSPGEGSRFLLEIPQVTPTVLVMDTEKDLRRSLVTILAADGLRVMEAGSEDTARKIIETASPNIIVAGFASNQEEAFSLIRWLRKNRETEGLPVVALVMDERERSSDTALRLGANGCVHRQEAAALLSGEVARLLGMSEADYS